MHYLTFVVHGTHYAVRLAQVREVVRYQPVPRLPDAPPWLVGLAVLRGDILPVLDLAAKCGFAPAAPGAETRLVVVEIPSNDRVRWVAVLVDAVMRVVEAGEGAPEPLPSLGARIASRYLLGVLRNGERLALVIDIGQVVESEGLLAASELMAGMNPSDLS